MKAPRVRLNMQSVVGRQGGGPKASATFGWREPGKPVRKRSIPHRPPGNASKRGLASGSDMGCPRGPRRGKSTMAAVPSWGLRR